MTLFSPQYLPLYSILRSGQREVTVYGAISIYDGLGRKVFTYGDTNYLLWTRSILKPWQLAGHLHILKEHFPDLEAKHFALMSASQSADDIQLQLLKEIEVISKVQTSHLRCPKALPSFGERKFLFQQQNIAPSANYHPCAGKHMGYILAQIAAGRDPDNYLQENGPQFDLSKTLLKHLLSIISQNQSIATTTDGCLLPNYGFSLEAMSLLYGQLGADNYNTSTINKPSSEELVQAMTNLSLIRAYFFDYPEIIGGSSRLDTRLMHELKAKTGINIIAKEGADGLLALGLPKSKNTPEGLGIIIKTSSGFYQEHLEPVAQKLLTHFLPQYLPKADEFPQHIQREFHFEPKKN
jgi:L-asparaginase II